VLVLRSIKDVNLPKVRILWEFYSLMMLVKIVLMNYVTCLKDIYMHFISLKMDRVSALLKWKNVFTVLVPWHC
jgi:hypothetical protein